MVELKVVVFRVCADSVLSHSFDSSPFASGSRVLRLLFGILPLNSLRHRGNLTLFVSSTSQESGNCVLRTNQYRTHLDAVVASATLHA